MLTTYTIIWPFVFRTRIERIPPGFHPQINIIWLSMLGRGSTDLMLPIYTIWICYIFSKNLFRFYCFTKIRIKMFIIQIFFKKHLSSPIEEYQLLPRECRSSLFSNLCQRLVLRLITKNWYIHSDLNAYWTMLIIKCRSCLHPSKDCISTNAYLSVCNESDVIISKNI